MLCFFFIKKKEHNILGNINYYSTIKRVYDICADYLYLLKAKLMPWFSNRGHNY